MLRRAGTAIGAITLTAHPAVIAAIRPDWIEALARQIGGAVTLRPDPALAMSAAMSTKPCPLCRKPASPTMRPSAAAAARTATC